jgi:hypothetical protein
MKYVKQAMIRWLIVGSALDFRARRDVARLLRKCLRRSVADLVVQNDPADDRLLLPGKIRVFPTSEADALT